MGRLNETTQLDGTPAPSQLSSTSISLGTPRKGAALLPETKVAALPPKVAGKNTERLQQDPRKEGYLKSRDDHVSKKEWDPMENLYDCREKEDARRLILQEHRKKLQATKVALAKKTLHDTRLGDAAAYKAKIHKEKIALQNVEPADEADVLKLSELLNRKLVTYERDPARRSWWKFFMLMDTDKAGVVAFSAFLRLIRHHLEIKEKELPEKLLRSVWKTLDFDETGYINSKKWGPFMKKGEGAVPKPGKGVPTWKERLHTQRRLEKEALDRELLAEKIAMKGVEPASDEEVLKLSQRLNDKMANGKNWHGGAIFPVDLEHGHSASLWYELFRKVDTKSYGVIKFGQFLQGIREVLLIDEKEWPEGKLRSVWAVLIADSGNGYLGAGKFGVWMRSGEPVPAKLTNLERRRLIGQKARQELNAKTAWRIEYERVAAAENMRQYDKETAAIQREIGQLNSLLHGTPRPQSARGADDGDKPASMLPQKPDTPWMYRPASARPEGRAKGAANWEEIGNRVNLPSVDP